MANRCDWCKEIIREGNSFGNRNFCSPKCKSEYYEKNSKEYKKDKIVQDFWRLLFLIFIFWIIYKQYFSSN